jgi:hypothetical protein
VARSDPKVYILAYEDFECLIYSKISYERWWAFWEWFEERRDLYLYWVKDKTEEVLVENYKLTSGTI